MPEHNAWLRAVIDTAVDGIVIIDAIGHVRLFNHACERLFGYSAEEVIGQNVKMLMPAPYRDEHDGYLSHYRTTGERRIIGSGRNVEGRRADGSTFPMYLSVGEITPDGGDQLFVGIIRDRTEQHAYEEALREQTERLRSIIETVPDAIIVIDEKVQPGGRTAVRLVQRRGHRP
jgi:two-component system sensor kinase FixL